MFGLSKKQGLHPCFESHLEDHIIQVEWSPDGKQLAAALVGGPVALFDAATGRRTATLPGHNFGTSSVSWRKDGLAIATGGQDGKVRIWDPATAALQATMDAGSDWVEKIAYNPATHQLLSAAGKTLRLWSESGSLDLEFQSHPSTISDVAWQTGTPYFTTVTYGRLAMFRSNEAVPSKQFEWKGSILRVAWSPDGNYVATGNQDASVHFWYRKSGKDLEMSGYASKVRELSWDSGSRYLATGGSPVVTIWDCSGKGPAGSRPIQLNGHVALLSALAYQGRGALLASGCRFGRVCLWQPAKNETRIAVAELGDEITQLRWSPDDRWLAASSGAGLLRVWSINEESH
jgi:WD40 repeat protein